MTALPATVLAIDPGRSKCGIAVVKRTHEIITTTAPISEVLHHSVVACDDLCSVVTSLCAQFEPSIVLVGNGTGSRKAADVAESAQQAPVVLVEERFSTIAARTRYFRHNPPRGLRRLIPTSLQVPAQPYDDYVAVILAERYLSA